MMLHKSPSFPSDLAPVFDAIRAKIEIGKLSVLPNGMLWKSYLCFPLSRLQFLHDQTPFTYFSFICILTFHCDSIFIGGEGGQHTRIPWDGHDEFCHQVSACLPTAKRCLHGCHQSSSKAWGEQECCLFTLVLTNWLQSILNYCLPEQSCIHYLRCLFPYEWIIQDDRYSHYLIWRSWPRTGEFHQHWPFIFFWIDKNSYHLRNTMIIHGLFSTDSE